MIWEPVLDHYDEDIALARPLTLGKGQFSLSTGVLLCIDCPSKGRDPRDPRTGRDKGRDKDPAKDRDHGRDPERDRDRDKDDKPHGTAEHPVCCKIDIQAVGEVVDTWVSGERAIGFRLTGLELIDITLGDLESVLEWLRRADEPLRPLTGTLRRALGDEGAHRLGELA